MRLRGAALLRTNKKKAGCVCAARLHPPRQSNAVGFHGIKYQRNVLTALSM